MPVEPANVVVRERLVVVELENSSWVVERGVRHTEWLVNVGGVWLRANEAPGALAMLAGEDPEDGSVDPDFSLLRPAGCQYLCRLRLRLPVGTAVRRRVSRPRETRRAPDRGTPARPRDLQRDILSYFKYVKPPLTVVETEFRVARGGLVRAEARTRRASPSGG